MCDRPELVFLDALDDVFLGFEETGAVAVWNSAAVEVTGYSAAELADATLADLLAGAELLTDPEGELFESGSAVVETDLVTADGKRLPYEFKAHRLPEGSPAAFAGIGRDVTERYRRRDRVERRERALREMYEIIADRELSFSEQVEALLSLGRTELDTDYGTLSKIDGEEYRFEIVDSADDSVEAGDVVPLPATNCERAASEEQTLVLGDVARDAPEETDRTGYVEWGVSCYIGAPVFVDDAVYGTFCFYDTEPREGQFLDWEVTLVDLMSRWVSYGLQRERTTDRLQEQNERLERFASIVSHDLRNPLNVLKGSIELAADSGDRENVERARRAVEQMETMIDDLLTLARSGEAIGETTAVELSSFTTSCFETVPAERATLSVETDRTVHADETRLRQLLGNLLKNAVEHGSTSGGPKADDATGESVTVTVGDLDGGFYVEDDGPGIPAEKREEVFESGYSTSNGGTGFGLAIVAEVADAHGWDVCVTEGAAGGARFEFTGVEN